MGMSWLLPRIVGMTRAAELMLTGRRLGAEEAERIGLVLKVVPDGKVVEAALEIAEQILRNTPFGVWMTKTTMWSNVETSSLEAAIDLEARTQILGFATQDQQEQMDAVREKRPPRYTNH
jgi:enoyl-CoA hydratase